MKRPYFILFVLSALFALSLCGCTPKGSPLPEGMEVAAVLEAGREIVALLNEGDYQTVYDRLREDGKEGIGPEDIQSYMQSVLDKAGDCRRETGAMATGQTLDSGEEYGTAVLSCRHRKKTAVYRVAFDREMNLMGLEISTR